jgi:membrane associated rhomboid family serine protease
VNHVLRTTASPTKVNDWSLVLTAASIHHHVHEHDGQFVLLVDDADAAAAGEALDAFDAEGAPQPPPPAPDLGWSPLGLLCAIGFAAMLLVTGNPEGGSVWFQVGSASARQILNGEWWRAVTALTLHAGIWHVVGNVIGSMLFISAAGRWIGGGLASVLILLSATAGNLLTAVRHHEKGHNSVGASTATFAALGLIAGFQVVRRLRLRNRPGRNSWLPIGAGLALFAMMGVGSAAYDAPEVDYWAHLFGLGCGVVVGLGWALLQLRRNWRTPGPVVQAALGALALAAITGSWWLAFHHA